MFNKNNAVQHGGGLGSLSPSRARVRLLRSLEAASNATPKMNYSTIIPGVTVLDVVVIARTDDQVPAVSFARVGVHQRCVPLLTTARVRILKRCSTVVPLVATTIVRVHHRQRLAGGYRGNLVTDTGLRFVLHRTAPFDHATLWAVECGFVLRVPGHTTVLGGTALRATVCSLLQVHPLNWPGKRQSTRDGKDHTDRHDVAVLNGEYE
uniref:Uncharacterized protein n=1 Tax=Anopheles merus TaxID=30066 RepID=A0A182VJZ3_ANOME